MQSLDCARRQGAKGWELRTTMTLAELRVLQGRSEEARRLLSTIYGQFAEGLATRDLKAAAQMLRNLEHSPDRSTSMAWADRAPSPQVRSSLFFPRAYSVFGA
jgi:predicted ATPase